jgi:hypothetical protein
MARERHSRSVMTVLALAAVAIFFGCERREGLEGKNGSAEAWSQEGLVVKRWGMFAQDVAVYGNYAYVASGDLEVVDIANPSRPSHLATLLAGGQVNRVAVAYPYLYLGSGSDGIRVVYVGNPRMPRLIGKIVVPAFIHHLLVDKDWLYVAGGSSGVLAYNIRYREAPVLKQTLAVPGEVLHIAKKGESFYLAAGSAGLKAMIRHPDGSLVLDPITDLPDSCVVGVGPIKESLLALYATYPGLYEFSGVPPEKTRYGLYYKETCRTYVRRSRALPTPLVGADFVIQPLVRGALRILKPPVSSDPARRFEMGECRYLGAALVRRDLVAVACGAGGLHLSSVTASGELETVGKVGGGVNYRQIVARGAVAASLVFHYAPESLPYLSPLCYEGARWIDAGLAGFDEFEKREGEILLFRDNEEPKKWSTTATDIDWLGENLGTFNGSEFRVYKQNGMFIRSHSLAEEVSELNAGEVMVGNYLLLWGERKIEAFFVLPKEVAHYKTLNLENDRGVSPLSRGNDIAFFQLWSTNRRVAFGPFGKGGEYDFVVVEDPNFTAPTGVDRWRNYLLIASGRGIFNLSGVPNRVYIYKMEGFPKKAPVATFSLEDEPLKLIIRGNYLFLGFPRRGLWVGHISRSPGHPFVVPVSGISATGCLKDFDVTNEYVFMAEGSNSLTRIPRPKWMR